MSENGFEESPQQKPESKNGSRANRSGKKKDGLSRQNGSYLPDTHRQLPLSEDAEKGVLGSILLEPTQIMDLCIERRIEPEFFYIPAHGEIYRVVRDLRETGKPIDLISVTQSLADQGLLDRVGGAGAIGDLFTFVPTAANADYYLEILKEKHLLRQVITTCTEFAARGYEEQNDVKMLLDEVEQRVFAIGEERFRGNLPEMKEQVMKAIETIENLYQNRGGLTGLATGFTELDKMTSGLHRGQMIVIAARPSVGKSSFAMNIAEHVAIEEKKPVGVFSLEMTSEELVQRLLCSMARIDLKKIRNGFLSKQDFPKLTSAANRLASSKIYIDDTPGLSVLELRAKARRMRDRHGIELVVVDYLQFVRSSTRRAQDNRQIEVAEVSYGLKSLAKELNIPIIVLAQLNRQPEAREGGKPRLSDLRESGSIEQDADVVGLLVRSGLYEKDEEAREEKPGEAELIIAKQRNGPTGEVPLTFLGQYTRFVDRARGVDAA